MKKITVTIRKTRNAFYGPKKWAVTDTEEEFLKYIRKLKMHNTWINETENDIEELQITHEDFTKRTPLRQKLYNFKGF